MKNDDIARLEAYVAGIREPENLFAGERLPQRFALPDNILVFFHDFTAPSPNAHGRYTLVAPLDRMTYFVERMRLEPEPGDMLLIPPHAMRYLHPGSPGYRRLFVTFELPEPQGYLPRAILNRPDPETWQMLWNVLDGYRGGKPEDCAWELFRLLRALNAGSAAAEPSALPAAVARAIEFMEKHLGEPIGMTDVAECAGVSESRLRAVFREHTGIAPGQYLLRRRFDAAKFRLLHTDWSIAEIARSCGFANVFVFGSFFRKHAGTPPLRFRKEAKKAPGAGCNPAAPHVH